MRMDEKNVRMGESRNVQTDDVSAHETKSAAVTDEMMYENQTGEEYDVRMGERVEEEHRENAEVPVSDDVVDNVCSQGSKEVPVYEKFSADNVCNQGSKEVPVSGKKRADNVCNQGAKEIPVSKKKRADNVCNQGAKEISVSKKKRADNVCNQGAKEITVPEHRPDLDNADRVVEEQDDSDESNEDLHRKRATARAKGKSRILFGDSDEDHLSSSDDSADDPNYADVSEESSDTEISLKQEHGLWSVDADNKDNGGSRKRKMGAEEETSKAAEEETSKDSSTPLGFVPCPDAESEYEDSDQLKSPSEHSSDDGGYVRKRRSPSYVDFGEFNIMEKPHLEVGMKFTDQRSFRKALKQLAILERRIFKYKKNEERKISAHCEKDDCDWRIYASWNRDGSAFEIKSFHPKHTCLKAHKLWFADARWFAERYMDVFRDDPYWKLEAMESTIRRELGLSVDPQQLYMARKIARSIIEGKGI